MRLDNRYYLAHRLAWFWVYGRWPSGELDHANRIRNDNRIANLRQATRGEQRHNSKTNSNNSHGARGIYRYYNRWVAQIRHNKKQHYLGTFATAQQAREAYSKAAASLFGEFARTE
jgi:hypothetical protein